MPAPPWSDRWTCAAAPEPMARSSQSNADDTNEVAASPAVSQTPEMTGRSQIPSAITPHTRGLERLGRG